MFNIINHKVFFYDLYLFDRFYLNMLYFAQCHSITAYWLLIRKFTQIKLLLV